MPVSSHVVGDLLRFRTSEIRRRIGDPMHIFDVLQWRNSVYTRRYICRSQVDISTQSGFSRYACVLGLACVCRTKIKHCFVVFIPKFGDHHESGESVWRLRSSNDCQFQLSQANCLISLPPEASDERNDRNREAARPAHLQRQRGAGARSGSQKEEEE